MRLQTPLTAELLDDLAADRDANAAMDAWLNVVSRLMRLPPATRQEICDELREHLHERVRDLLLVGRDERDAVRTAIEELGETAHLARRFEAANQPRPRRLLMHALFTIVGAGAVTAGMMTFTSSNSSPTIPFAYFDAANASANEPPKSLVELKCSVGFDDSLRQALGNIASRANVGLMVNWRSLENVGVECDEPLAIKFDSVSGTHAMKVIAQAASTPDDALDWRVRDGGIVEFGLRDDLDRSEIELVTYDVNGMLERLHENFAESYSDASQQVIELLATMVEPNRWEDNGGDMARMRLVGGRLFVQAPASMQKKVAWILSQWPGNANNQERASTAAESEVPLLRDIPILHSVLRDSADRLSPSPAGETIGEPMPRSP